MDTHNCCREILRIHQSHVVVMIACLAHIIYITTASVATWAALPSKVDLQSNLFLACTLETINFDFGHVWRLNPWFLWTKSLWWQQTYTRAMTWMMLGTVSREIFGHDRLGFRVFPSPTGYMLWFFEKNSLLIWGIFHRFLYSGW